jgi:multiple sugar transport system ATP-binding protein
MHRPANKFVAGFIGSPPMNFLDGRFEEGVFVAAGLRLPAPPPAGDQRDLTLGVRPEDIELSLVEQPDWTPGRVWVAEQLGNETLIRFHAGAAQFTARVPADLPAAFDQPLWWRIKAEVHWFRQ